MRSRTLRSGYLGRVDYTTALEWQHALRQRILDRTVAGGADVTAHADAENHLLLLEHPPVFTLGRNASQEHILAEQAWLADRGIEVHEADRGGEVTFHGPGQLVGYPIVDLKPDRRDIRRYVRDLQEVLMRTLAEYGIRADPGLDGRPVGVWVKGRKIASIGVHLRHWVSTHGFALNVSTDLSYFSGIVACGMPKAPMTTLAELTNEAPDLPTIAETVATHFREVFSAYPGAPLSRAELTRTGGAMIASGSSGPA
ncbi:MAG: lipoyl(octanoyl) transferase LipB [Acidobacteriota bacterium]|nr:lipoyl(octanoyl) transferase LipB [Acidobacteriota bacterium]